MSTKRGQPQPVKAVRVLSRPDVVSASVSARSQGLRVEVESERSESSSTWVNPDGSLTSEVFGGPVRTRGVDGGWRDLDFDLVVGSDGSVGPGVHPAGLRLSGGSSAAGLRAGGGVSEVVSVVQSPVQGAAADARLAEREAKKAARGAVKKGGRQAADIDGAALVGARVAAAERSRVSFGWGGVLPRPVLSGSTATYRDVQPGVDLVVKVLRTGYEQFFVIRSAAGLRGLQAEGAGAGGSGGGGGVSWDLPVSAPGLTGVDPVSWTSVKRPVRSLW